MPARRRLRHLGGGRKGLYLLLRYVFIATASYLLLFHGAVRASARPIQAVTIALALASNVALSVLPVRKLFAWWSSAALLVADTVWVAWALHALGRVGEEFFLLYLIVLVLAAVSENRTVVIGGALIASALSVYNGWRNVASMAPALLRVAFLFTAALFYGHVLDRIRTERKRADRNTDRARALETKVAERTSELRRLYHASRAASDAKSEFVASMSHEMRTPLHIVIGYADMLLDGGATTPEAGAALAARIRAAAAGLLHLVDGALEIQRLESGAVRVEKGLVAVDAFVHDLARREWIAPHAGVRLRWDVQAHGASVETDRAKLEIVISNLVTNALKYTTAGEVVVAVRDSSPDARVEFHVADTGPGIPPERIARMREPFHESTGAAHRIGGIGLGLSIVYRYAALLGAELRVESTLGRGTTFVVALPDVHDAPRGTPIAAVA